MNKASPPMILRTLDAVFGVGAESIVETARRGKLLQGVAVGIFRDGQSFVRYFGEHVGPESRFEIGSVTKTYTAELLALLVERGTVRLEDPVALYLPGGLRNHNAERPVRLLDLATHHSGLPRLPPGLGFSRNPYGRYRNKHLEADLSGNPLRLPDRPQFAYSNFGYSVLGYALGRAAGTTYAELLVREILEPLKMEQTSLALGQAQPGLLRGHTKSGIWTRHWTFDACAPCGALCSTAADQLQYLAWLLQDTDRLSLRPQMPARAGNVGLGWILREGSQDCWHNGATFGFSSYLSLNRSRRSGLVVLSQVAAANLVTEIGRMLEGSLAGEAIKPLR